MSLQCVMKGEGERGREVNKTTGRVGAEVCVNISIELYRHQYMVLLCFIIKYMARETRLLIGVTSCRIFIIELVPFR